MAMSEKRAEVQGDFCLLSKYNTNSLYEGILKEGHLSQEPPPLAEELHRDAVPLRDLDEELRQCLGARVCSNVTW